MDNLENPSETSALRDSIESEASQAGSQTGPEADSNQAAAPSKLLEHAEIPRWIAAGLLLALLLLFAGIRWRLREMPLERDEGEYAYAGQLMLQGIPPYQLAYNMKLPGTYVAYAGLMRVLGQTAAGLHLGVLLLNAGTTLILYFAARRRYGRAASLIAAASYALLSTSEAVLGLSGHATHFVVLAAAPGILLLLAARNSENWKVYLAAGMFMGLAFVMKQPGAVFIAFGFQQILFEAWQCSEKRKTLLAHLLSYGAGAALPYAATCLWLYRAGVFGKFWFWTVSYASQYAGSTGAGQGFRNFQLTFPDLLLTAPLIWILAIAGLWIAIREGGLKSILGFEFSLLVWSFLGASAGLYYREHYFILLLPAVSLLAAKTIEWLSTALSASQRGKSLAAAPWMIFAIAFALTLFAQRRELFELSPSSLVRAQYGGNPFPEAIEFGKYIHEHSDPDAQIGILGSEPEICFYAGRRSATGYIYTYPLMEEQKYSSQMQREMIGEIEKNRPEYMVEALVPTSWLRKPNSDVTILEWGERYLSEHYRLVGLADIGLQTKYYWDDAALGITPHSKYSLYLYKRKI